MSIEKNISLIDFEITQVEQLLNSYDLLLKKCRTTEPDLIELTAAASVIHSFYNGVENIFLTIAKRIDEQTPLGLQWHRDLLKQMNSKVKNREYQVISESTLTQLIEYMGFRHFYRHSYSFVLKWSEMKRLILNIEDTWVMVKTDIQQFLKQLKTQIKDGE